MVVEIFNGKLNLYLTLCLVMWILLIRPLACPHHYKFGINHVYEAPVKASMQLYNKFSFFFLVGKMIIGKNDTKYG